MPAPLDRDPEPLEAEALDVRLAAGGDEQPLGHDRVLALELQPERLAASAALDPRRARVEAELDALLGEGPGEELGRLGVQSRQQAPAALDERHAGAEPRVGLRQLAADRAAADDREALRHGARARPLAAAPVRHLRQPLDRRRHGDGAGGDEQRVVREFPLAHGDEAGLGDDAGPADELGALLRHPLGLAGVVLLGDLVAPPEDLRRVDGADRLGRPRGEARARDDLERPQQDLRGDAGPVGALAADELVLDDRDLGVGVELAQRRDERLARGPGAQDDDAPEV